MIELDSQFKRLLFVFLLCAAPFILLYVGNIFIAFNSDVLVTDFDGYIEAKKEFLSWMLIGVNGLIFLTLYLIKWTLIAGTVVLLGVSILFVFCWIKYGEKI